MLKAKQSHGSCPWGLSGDFSQSKSVDVYGKNISDSGEERSGRVQDRI